MNVIALLAGLTSLTLGFYLLWRSLNGPPLRRPARHAPAEPAAPPPRAKDRAPARNARPPKPAARRDADKATAAAEPPAEKPKAALASLVDDSDDGDITIITRAPLALEQKPVEVARIEELPSLPELRGKATQPLTPFEEDDDDEGARSSKPSAVPIVFDDDARDDEPPRDEPWILIGSAARTDRGRKRRRNEDAYLVLEAHHVFVVADGMGGHVGGDVASKMAVDVIGRAFEKGELEGDPYPDVPRRGAELAQAIQAANKAIFDHARANSAYRGMGTTLVGARFSPHNQRVYIGHVGDSRCYRLRAGKLTQITTDHTMATEGISGPLATHLNRAVGILPGVKVDLLIGRPLPDDVYLICSDGLSKMVPDDQIQQILASQHDVEEAVGRLVDEANALGGKDNITVVVVQVKDAAGLKAPGRAGPSDRAP